MILTKTGILPILLIIFMTTMGFIEKTFAQDVVVRIAKLNIDSAQLDNYKAFLKEEIEASIQIEAGVLTLNAVADKKNLNQITIFEIYANQEAYLAHIKTPHFLKYKTGTKDMVKSLELMDTVPIALKSKTEIAKD